MVNNNLMCGKLGDANLIIDLIPVSNTTSRPQIKMVPKYITVHNTGNSKANARQNSTYVDTATGYVSWHFTVDDKDIFQELPLNETAWHAGDSRGQGNMASIGIEICEHIGIDWEQAKANAVYLIRTLMRDFNIPIERVVPHQKWSGKYCPRKILDEGWDKFIDLIKSEDNAIPDPIKPTPTENKEVSTITVDVSKYPVLKHKSSGAHVRILEERLRDLKYQSRFIDDYFGTITIDAVKKFQSDKGLVADGIVGQNTWKKLFEGNTVYTPRTPIITPKIGYEQIRFENITDVHIWRSKTAPKIVLGTRWKQERLTTIVNQYKGVKAATNCGFFSFDGKTEHLGILIADGLYYQPTSPNFLEFTSWRNGDVTVEKPVHNVQKYIKMQNEANFSIGVGFSIITNGLKDFTNSEKFAHSKQRHPRTLLCYDDINKMWASIVIDGRLTNNTGANIEDMYRLCKQLGFRTAVALDGGDSSDLFVEGMGIVSGNKRDSRNIGSVIAWF
ncbi:MAG: N-acetylmuramoyl-L-alanine amidase [Vallitaleaceae bacterium]|nr:N-acetylmuramoyl-L-alanine amidase [Vallitaleaceae bacterium]